MIYHIISYHIISYAAWSGGGAGGPAARAGRVLQDRELEPAAQQSCV